MQGLGSLHLFVVKRAKLSYPVFSLSPHYIAILIPFFTAFYSPLLQFVEAHKRYLEIENAMRSLVDHCVAYTKAVTEVTALQSFIANDLLFFAEQDDPQRACLEAYCTTMQEFNNRKTAQVFKDLREKVIDPMKQFLANSDGVAEVVEKRLRKKKDMDYYKQKVSVDKPQFTTRCHIIWA